MSRLDLLLEALGRADAEQQDDDPPTSAACAAGERRRVECEARLEALSEQIGLPDDLVSSTLQDLDLDPCAAALELLGQGGASQDDVARMLLEQHLEGCQPCSVVERALTRMAVDLQELADLDPGAGFTRQVLLITSSSRCSRVEQKARGLASRIRSWFSTVARRPRFALEAAYALSMLLLLLTRVDPLLASKLEQSPEMSRQMTAEISGSLSRLATDFDQQVATMSTDVYQAVDASLHRTSGVYQDLMSTMTTLSLPDDITLDRLVPPAWRKPSEATEPGNRGSELSHITK